MERIGCRAWEARSQGSPGLCVNGDGPHGADNTPKILLVHKSQTFPGFKIWFFSGLEGVLSREEAVSKEGVGPVPSCLGWLSTVFQQQEVDLEVLRKNSYEPKPWALLGFLRHSCCREI